MENTKMPSKQSDKKQSQKVSLRDLPEDVLEKLAKLDSMTKQREEAQRKYREKRKAIGLKPVQIIVPAGDIEIAKAHGLVLSRIFVQPDLAASLTKTSGVLRKEGDTWFVTPLVVKEAPSEGTKKTTTKAEKAVQK
jgi:hypothetical protein